MGFGTLSQLIGGIGALVWALATHQWVVAALIGWHLSGDAVVGFIRPLAGLLQLEVDAAKFVKLRGFIAFLGVAFMVVFHNCHIDVTIFWHHALTSNGLFQLGEMLAFIGYFTYREMYT